MFTEFVAGAMMVAGSAAFEYTVNQNKNRKASSNFFISGKFKCNYVINRILEPIAELNCSL